MKTNKLKRLSLLTLLTGALFSPLSVGAEGSEVKRTSCTMTIYASKNHSTAVQRGIDAQATGVCEGLVTGIYSVAGGYFLAYGMYTGQVVNGQTEEIYLPSGEYIVADLTFYTVNDYVEPKPEPEPETETDSTTDTTTKPSTGGSTTTTKPSTDSTTDTTTKPSTGGNTTTTKPSTDSTTDTTTKPSTGGSTTTTKPSTDSTTDTTTKPSTGGSTTTTTEKEVESEVKEAEADPKEEVTDDVTESKKTETSNEIASEKDKTLTVKNTNVAANQEKDDSNGILIGGIALLSTLFVGSSYFLTLRKRRNNV